MIYFFIFVIQSLPRYFILITGNSIAVLFRIEAGQKSGQNNTKIFANSFFYYRKMSIYFKTFCLLPYSKRAKLLYNVFTNLYNHNTELTDIASQSKWKLVWRWLFIGGVKSKSRGLHVQSFDEFCHTNEHQTPQGMFSVEYTVGS